MLKKILLYAILSLSYLFYHTIMFCIVEEFIFTHEFPFAIQCIFVILYLIGVAVIILIHVESIFRKEDKYD